MIPTPRDSFSDDEIHDITPEEQAHVQAIMAAAEKAGADQSMLGQIWLWYLAQKKRKKEAKAAEAIKTSEHGLAQAKGEREKRMKGKGPDTGQLHDGGEPGFMPSFSEHETQ